ncbi:exonuclease subunit SbcD [Hydrogenobacter thermophilus]|uniref:metallophosphoesterase family protein n=1 Tax=Hydrogenobacter thermophilus TaxID=940 RepID=UPI0030F5111F
MRLLHISDLHAGKTLGRTNRNEDLHYALEQVISICREEKVDVLLIAGDIYDKSNPDHESHNLIMDFLTRIHTMGIHTVLIAGNHDSYDLIKSYKNLGRVANIHAFDRPCKNPKDCIIKLGNITIACLPYPSERVITHIEEHTQRSYTEKVANYLKALAKEVEDAQQSVLLAHIMIEKAKVSGTERQASIGEFYAIKPEHIPKEFNYVALGHVHRHQQIISSRIYYSGSLYQIDFSEKGMEKYVNLVLLEEQEVRPIKLDLKRELYEVRIGVKDNFNAVLSHLKGLKGLVKVVLETDMRDSTISIKKKNLEDVLGERLVRFEIEPIAENNAEESYKSEKLDLVSAYETYYRKTYRCQLPEDIKKEFINILGKAEHEAHTA